MTYPEFLFIFITGSIAGFLLEGIWKMIRTGAWENHSATLYGPFCIIYGVGAAALYGISGFVIDFPLWTRFLVFALTGALTEYVGSVLQEKLFGSVSWDYSDRFLNIHGRTCFSMTMIWGILGLLFSRFCFPVINRFFSAAANWPVDGICIVLSVLMSADLMISAGALFRWYKRIEGIPARNPIEERLDKHYNNERMEKIYNNLEFIDQSQ